MEFDRILEPGANLARELFKMRDKAVFLKGGDYETDEIEVGENLHVAGPHLFDSSPLTAKLGVFAKRPRARIKGIGPYVFNTKAGNFTGLRLDVSGSVAGGDKTHGRGFSFGTGHTLTGCYIHDCPTAGAGGWGGKVVRCEVARCGSVGDLGDNGGGLKSVTELTVDRSYVHDCIGNGVWLDCSGKFLAVRDSLIASNSRKGVHYEISAGKAFIVRNLFQRNGTGEGEDRPQHSAYGVTITSSQHAWVERNKFVDEGKGAVMVWNDDREEPGDANTKSCGHGYTIKDVHITDNDFGGCDTRFDADVELADNIA